MKKVFAILLSIVLILTLTGCGDKDSTNVKKKKTSNNYVPIKAEPKGLPIYPGAVLNRDYEVTVVEDEDSTYWSWAYSTTGSAAEIIEYYKSELTKLGYTFEKEDIFDRYFTLTTTDSDIVVSYSSIYKSNRDTLPDEVDGDTPGRDYTIKINLDKWNY